MSMIQVTIVLLFIHDHGPYENTESRPLSPSQTRLMRAELVISWVGDDQRILRLVICMYFFPFRFVFSTSAHSSALVESEAKV